MALIKNAQADRLARDAIVLDLGDLARQGERILQQARDQAAQLLAQARAEAASLTEGAEARGFEQGRAQGLEEGHAEGSEAGRAEALAAVTIEAQAIISAWTAAMDDFEQKRAAMLLAAREECIALGIAIGHKVAHRLVQQDPTIVADQVRDALALLVKPTAAVIRINPDDRAIVDQLMPTIVQQVGASAHLSIMDDARLGRGGCVISVTGGEIDASIETQLSRIVAALMPSADDHPLLHETRSTP